MTIQPGKKRAVHARYIRNRHLIDDWLGAARPPEAASQRIDEGGCEAACASFGIPQRGASGTGEGSGEAMAGAGRGDRGTDLGQVGVGQGEGRGCNPVVGLHRAASADDGCR